MEQKMKENRKGGGGEIPFKESRKIINGKLDINKLGRALAKTQNKTPV
jgi:hypothetical protein